MSQFVRTRWWVSLLEPGGESVCENQVVVQFVRTRWWVSLWEPGVCQFVRTRWWVSFWEPGGESVFENQVVSQFVRTRWWVRLWEPGGGSVCEIQVVSLFVNFDIQVLCPFQVLHFKCCVTHNFSYNFHYTKNNITKYRIKVCIVQTLCSTFLNIYKTKSIRRICLRN